MSMLNLPAPQWIEGDDALAQICQQWLKEACLALDTEFVRMTTFYPQPGLIQVATLEDCWLIDPLAISDWQPFADVLTAPDVVKIFHACAEDLEVCRRLCGVVPQPLFDTQLAMALAGEGSSVGFQKAVESLLGIAIPKEATRSDWLKRPLSDVQIDYATADVYFLRRLYPGLRERLEDSGRLVWLQEEAERTVQVAAEAETDLKASYRRVKLGWKLRPQEQNILQSLSEWRELEARRLDVPRNKVADDQTLWNLARFKARNRDQLSKAGMRSNIIRESAREVLKRIEVALGQPPEQWPEALTRPLSISAGNLMKTLKKKVVARAEELQVPAEILANKKMIEALVRARGKTVPEPLQGWRYSVITQELTVLLEQSTDPAEESDE